MELKEIVPEYHSQNVFIRALFLSRLKSALALAAAKLGKEENLKILDLGCGEGYFLKLLEERFQNIQTFGVDIEPNIQQLKKFLRAEIKIADLRESVFPAHFFDAIFCLDVLEHFADLAKPLEEIKRTLKADGLLIISLPTESWFYKLGRFFLKGTASEKAGPASSPHYQSARSVERFLSQNGWEIVQKISLPPFSPWPLFRIISLRKKNG